MNVNVIEMPRHKARQKFREYRDAVRRGTANDVDAELMRTYKAISQGKMVLDLAQAIVKAGADHRGYPKLAVVRADAEKVHFFYEDFRPVLATYRGRWDAGKNGRRDRTKCFGLPWSSLSRPHNRTNEIYAWAKTPTIPPNLRPTAALDQYHILWEAEWNGPPPTDPLLLRKIAGKFYAVVAQWDLTPLEKAAMENGFA